MSYDLRRGDIDYLRSIPGAVHDQQMYGMEPVVKALMVALLSGGHVLLEGNPGLGKTALVRALSQALGLGRGAVGRIQFTPDLMPADITGTLMPAEDGSRRLEFKAGPIFHQLLLADEINRATPKTQAAMLEAMAEYQVTVLGETKPLRKWSDVTFDGRRERVRSPFMVMATQNPVDQDGTYDLPEAQSDRFMFKILMQMPDAAVIAQIMDKELAPPFEPSADTVVHHQADEALARLHLAASAVMSLRLSAVVKTHIVNIVQASNGGFSHVVNLSEKRMAALRDLVGNKITYPFGPRAASSLAKAAVGWAAVDLARADSIEQIPGLERCGLAAVVVPVLRHRLKIRHDYQDMDASSAGAEARALNDYIAKLAMAAAPDLSQGDEPRGYDERFASDLITMRARNPL
jgi:MoxR-like ATPase